jgi:heparosan-N-sulfate-glucuronate 5-epimerase
MRSVPGLVRIPLPLIARALRDLRMQDYPVETAGTPLDGSGLYPLDLRASRPSSRHDPGGIIVIAGPDGRDYHNPVSASLYALGQHTDSYRSTDNRDRNVGNFLTQARHLRLSQDSNGGWRYPVPVIRYQVAPGWYSAMAQGLAISVLLRAYDFTGERGYFDAAELAAALLLRPLCAGGCSDYDESGRPFLEECPSDPPSHILNGALFALIGLRELEARTAGDAHAAAARRLAAQLGQFDLGYWSRYDLRFAAPATQAYHCLHISLLQVAGRLLGDPCFSDTAVRWRSFLDRPGYRLRAAANKAWFVFGVGSA